ncbi:hypothetical protein Anapl_00565 [Anas platyrhynchos]|uniref:Uncharacterized protein n=1 Tax=Anas platyrhynchos TaxID=8839 RepID=R0LVZ6_ANAPL|nr:hypothetical protein Anapl_00565 [Anas platyrhynchos]
MNGAWLLSQPDTTKRDLSGDAAGQQSVSTSLISATASGSNGESNCRRRGVSAVTAEGPGKSSVACVMSPAAAAEGACQPWHHLSPPQPGETRTPGKGCEGKGEELQGTLQGINQLLPCGIRKHILPWTGYSTTVRNVSSAAADVGCCLRWMEKVEGPRSDPIRERLWLYQNPPQQPLPCCSAQVVLNKEAKTSGKVSCNPLEGQAVRGVAHLGGGSSFPCPSIADLLLHTSPGPGLGAALGHAALGRPYLCVHSSTPQELVGDMSECGTRPRGQLVQMLHQSSSKGSQWHLSLLRQLRGFQLLTAASSSSSSRGSFCRKGSQRLVDPCCSSKEEKSPFERGLYGLSAHTSSTGQHGNNAFLRVSNRSGDQEHRKRCLKDAGQPCCLRRPLLQLRGTFDGVPEHPEGWD